MSWTNRLIRHFFQKGIAPLCVLVAVLSATLLLVATPLVWEKIYTAPDGLPESAQADGELIAEHLWTDKPYSEVSIELQGGRLYKVEMEHYEDLQDKFVQLLILMLCTGCVSGLCFLRQDVRKILFFSLLWLVVISAVFTVWALNDWRHFYRTLHWWLFQDDSWILPDWSYSLRLYPYAVWQKAMVWMACGSFAIYAVLFLLASLRIWVGARFTLKESSIV